MLATARNFAVEYTSMITEAVDDRVDRENKVIRNVRVLGLESRNIGRVLGLEEKDYGPAVDKPYAYTMEALRSARDKYEGADVYSNHRKFDYDEKTGRRIVVQEHRENEERLGWLENVRAVEGKGLYADLHYLDSHPYSGQLCEIAERNPSKLALSHEAFFDAPKVINGKLYLTEITSVDSVALVCSEPGTTNGLFEQAPKGAKTMKFFFRQIVETAPKSKLRSLAIEAMGASEDDTGAINGALEGDVADMEVDVPAESTPEDQLKSGLLAALMKAAEGATADQLKGALAAFDMVDSVSEIIAGKPEGPPAVEAKPEEPTADEDDKDKMFECMSLIQSAGAKPQKRSVIEYMLTLTPIDRKEFAAELPKMVAEANDIGIAPAARSKGGDTKKPVAAETGPDVSDPDVFVAELFKRNPSGRAIAV